MQSEAIDTKLRQARILLREKALPMSDEEMDAMRGGQSIGCTDAGLSHTVTTRRQQEGCDNE